MWSLMSRVAAVFRALVPSRPYTPRSVFNWVWGRKAIQDTEPLKTVTSTEPAHTLPTQGSFKAKVLGFLLD